MVLFKLEFWKKKQKDHDETFNYDDFIYNVDINVTDPMKLYLNEDLRPVFRPSLMGNQYQKCGCLLSGCPYLLDLPPPSISECKKKYSTHAHCHIFRNAKLLVHVHLKCIQK